MTANELWKAISTIARYYLCIGDKLQEIYESIGQDDVYWAGVDGLMDKLDDTYYSIFETVMALIEMRKDESE